MQPLRAATECEVDLVRKRLDHGNGLRPWIPKQRPEFHLCATESHPLTWTSPCEDCSAFTRVAACTLALSPIRDTLIEGFSHFVTSMTAPIASGGSEFTGWGLHPLESAALHGAHPKRKFGSQLSMTGVDPQRSFVLSDPRDSDQGNHHQSWPTEMPPSHDESSTAADLSMLG